MKYTLFIVVLLSLLLVGCSDNPNEVTIDNTKIVIDESEDTVSVTIDGKEVLNAEETGEDGHVVGSLDMGSMTATVQGGDRKVEGNLKELCLYESNMIIVQVDDEYSYTCMYTSELSVKGIAAYFKELLTDTPGYLIVENDEGAGVIIQGTINDTIVAISVIEDADQGLSIISYGYDK